MAPAEIQKAASEAGLPATIELPTCDIVDETIDTGGAARCFAQYMRIHALEASGGLTYAQMGRFQSAEFSIVVGVALILTGIGLVILAFAVFGRDGARKEALGA